MVMYKKYTHYKCDLDRPISIAHRSCNDVKGLISVNLEGDSTADVSKDVSVQYLGKHYILYQIFKRLS